MTSEQQRLVEKYLPFVKSRVSRYLFNRTHNTKSLREDLYQSGVEGLCRAAQEFKPELGFTFLTYASHWVDKEIHKAALNNSHGMKVYRTRVDGELKYIKPKVESNEDGQYDPFAEPETLERRDGGKLASMVQEELSKTLKPRDVKIFMRRMLEEDVQLEELGKEAGVTKQRAHQIFRGVEPHFEAWAKKIREEV